MEKGNSELLGQRYSRPHLVTEIITIILSTFEFLKHFMYIMASSLFMTTL